MGEWREATVAELGTIFDGPHATPTRRSSGAYFLNISSLKNGRLDLSESDHVSDEDFQKWTRRVTPTAGDLLFSYETRLGEAALMPAGVKACLGRRMALLRPDRSRFDPRFLLYLYLGPAFQEMIAERSIHGATVSRIPLASMPEWPVFVPDLQEQCAIADVLGALDDKIAANNTILDTIRELLVSKFEQLGIDSSGEADERSGTVADLMYINPRETVNPAEEAPFLEMKNLPDAAMTVSDWAYRAPKGGAKFRNGDTLLARITPCLENGKVGYVDFLNVGEVGVGSTEFIVMRPRDGVPKALPWLLSKSPKFREYAIKHMAGTSGRQRLSARDIGPYPVTIPSSAQMESFSKLSDHLLKVIHGRVVENRSLAHTRDELLPLLMSGAITVKTAAQIVEKVN